ncbi:MAG: GNAT family N-acetyltransferase [Zhongshania sp.]|uniref:GNAT family N-acetyltransferase n=1 Tax=Zhongshania sp. TaxID=1971902 RepID=UPI0026131268|nr:GNAT family N-acetyltransferase [Zhongshania sp.]MDF1693733.1 GNAT family N-acetyltransferase [Zhongshania sp.]
MVELEFINAISAIDAATWNAIAGQDYPFTRHEFLQALESSGAVAADKGWQPHHLVARRDGQIVALMPLYIKTHSYGEYVFDWSWADAYQRHGRSYYPKLLAAIPFTPATGPRLCLANDAEREDVMQAIASSLPAHARQMGASSVHILFSKPEVSSAWQPLGFMQRSGPQYHWFDRDYGDFDGFLASFSSRKRKTLRKERKAVAEQGLDLQILCGSEISPAQWRFFFHCYQLTYAKRSGHGGYLPEAFFTQLAATMPEHLVLVIASHGDEPVAVALNFRDQHTLYGRYWGCVREYEFLHFETCYYQGIEYCLREGLRHFDPGAQGEHKIQRGFMPIATYSNHWLADADFSAAVAQFLDDEKLHIAKYLRDASAMLPFKQDN